MWPRMSNEMVFVGCHFGGLLKTIENYGESYVGGRFKLLKLNCQQRMKNLSRQFTEQLALVRRNSRLTSYLTVVLMIAKLLSLKSQMMRIHPPRLILEIEEIL